MRFYFGASKVSKPVKRTRHDAVPAQLKPKAAKVQQSQKIAEKRTVAQSRKDPQFCIYVGNIHPRVTEEEVAVLFRGCEGFFKVTLRCSQGLAVKPGPDTVLDLERDIQYATVEFTEWHGFYKAVNLNGIRLAGRRLSIGITTAHLPEMHRIIQDHTQPDKSTKRKRPLVLQPTVPYIEPVHQDRNKAFSRFSFPKTVI